MSTYVIDSENFSAPQMARVFLAQIGLIQIKLSKNANHALRIVWIVDLA